MRQHRRKPGKFYKIDLAHMLNELFEVPYDQHYRRPVFGKRIVNAMFDSIAAALQRGEEVKVKGFGTFRFRTTPRRLLPKQVVIGGEGGDLSKNIYSPVPLMRGGKKVVVFEPSIQLMAMLNKSNPNYKEHRSTLIWSQDDN